ncbi:MAG: DNA repair protein RecN [Rikenellaceae bacterium]|nr:DNA repair protein RecN [Rikenellaceae bacterium]
MLRRLTVENYALIECLSLELSPSLNIITGETGAGKSILLGALGLLLGARNDGAAQKDPARNCVVEGVFDIGDYGLEELFERNDLDWQRETVIRRVVTPAGKSRAYVNDLPVQLTALRELGSRLIDIHSQHQSLMLADEGFRIAVLDNVAGLGAQLGSYRAAYAAMREAGAELAAACRRIEEAGRDREWLQYQVEQLDALNLREGEQQELEEELRLLTHADSIREAMGMSLESLEDEQTGVLCRLKGVEHALAKVREGYGKAGELADRLHAVMLELKDIDSELAAEGDRVEADPGRLQWVSERLDAIYSLQQKHRVATCGELIALWNEFRTRLQAIATGEETLAELEQAVERSRGEAEAAAAVLTEGRRRAGAELGKGVDALLAELGMPGAEFRVEVASAPLSPGGGDAVRYLFSANRKMPLQPVEKTASGGEISRVMLALKSLVAHRSKLPTIIFDEIDTGVSGRIADAMGGIICRLAEDMQVVNITHLPQVASKGDTHFFVYKEETEQGTSSRIRRLDSEERRWEIAKMLSGSTVTEAALAQARVLLENN